MDYSLTKEEVEKRLEELERKIIKADKLYFKQHSAWLDCRTMMNTTMNKLQSLYEEKRLLGMGKYYPSKKSNTPPPE